MEERYQFGFVPEQNREKIQRMRYVVSLSERGLKKPSKTAGYVGTSIAGLENLINHGSLPGGSFQDPHFQEYLLTEFRYIPAKLSLREPKVRFFSDLDKKTKSYKTEDFPLADAKNDAFLLARTHAFLVKLGINPADQTKIITASLLLETGTDDFVKQEALEKFIALGHSEQFIKLAQAEAEKFRGFVLTLNSDKIGELKESVQSEFTHVLETSAAGLSLDFFDGLENQGPIEKDFIGSLKGKL